jgi:DNA repair exonuclease SbcCD ATPase subunit
MKNIIIKKIGLINFKGLRNQEINFDKTTSIFGDNGTGKTTIFDAFTWLMFGKDSTDRKDFEIKTLDKHNIVIPQIEHEVSAIILVEGEEISIRRILKENWVKKRGSLESEFSGNVTDYYWNEVPMQQKEFQTKVSQILDETVFKMITNPLAFNAMKWQDRRNALIQIAGEISEIELAAGNSEYEKLLEQLTQGKTLEDYRKQIAASIKKAKEDLKAIPTRIDEVSRSRPEEHDFKGLKTELDSKVITLEKLDAEIADANTAFQSKLDAVRAEKIKVNNLSSEIETIEHNARKEATSNGKPDTEAFEKSKRLYEEKKAELNGYEGSLRTLVSNRDSLKTQITSVKSKMDAKRNEWTEVNAKTFVFDDSNCSCPTCKRSYPEGDIEATKSDLKKNFEEDKKAKLLLINQAGASLKAELESTEAELKALEERIAKGETYITNAKTELEKLKSDFDYQTEQLNKVETSATDIEALVASILKNNQVYQEKLIMLEGLKSSLQEVPSVDNSELVEKRKSLVAEIDTIKAKLQNEVQINSVNQRIEDLKKEESTLAQQIANVEKTQFVIENFNKLKIDTLEERINAKFKFVKFKMFQTQINGGEIECCDALIDGVPFSDANTASKINAGLDIINTLCEFYQVTAPIFIDNRESIVQLINTESQVVNLIVSEVDKKLRVA